MSAALDDVPMLLDYQQRWFADESDVKICEKSRRIGISWTSAAEAVFFAAESRGDAWYIGYSEDQGEEFVRDVADWAKVIHGAATDVDTTVLEDVDPETGATRAIKAFRVDFATGCKVTALSSRPRNLRGKQGLVIIDEAAYHDDLPGLMKAATALLMWGGRVELISTHNGVDNPFAQLIEDVRAGKLKYSLHRYTLDDALADGLYKRIAMVKGERWSAEREQDWREGLLSLYGEGAQEELFCVPSRGGISYFAREVVESRMQQGRPVVRLFLESDFVSWPEARREEHVTAWLDAEIAPLLAKLPNQSHFVGYDFGRKSDLSSVCPMTLRKDLVRDVPFVVELGNVPFEQQKQIAYYILGGLPQLAGARFDATGNGAYLAEVCMQKFGDVVEQVKITEKWHTEEWAPLRAGLEDGKVLLPADQDLRNDFAAVKRVNGIPKLPTASKTGAEVQGVRLTRHGDFAVACALAYGASRKGEAELRRWDALASA